MSEIMPNARYAHGTDWRSQAVCRSGDAELLFVAGALQREAALMCRQCPVKRECAADALDNNLEYGVWGGLTERQRRTLLKQYPQVKSWAIFLTQHPCKQDGRARPWRQFASAGIVPVG